MNIFHDVDIENTKKERMACMKKIETRPGMNYCEIEVQVIL